MAKAAKLGQVWMKGVAGEVLEFGGIPGHCLEAPANAFRQLVFSLCCHARQDGMRFQQRLALESAFPEFTSTGSAAGAVCAPAQEARAEPPAVRATIFPVGHTRDQFVQGLHEPAQTTQTAS